MAFEYPYPLTQVPEATDIVRRKLSKWLHRLDLRVRRDSLKYQAEVEFWRNYHGECGGRFPNRHYQALLLALAGESDPAFLRDRVVADFGCGPCGSLEWAEPARARLGIDVLADAYREFDTAAHAMTYVRSTERSIPLETGSVDVLFTINALDHVSHFGPMCRELLRIMAPGGRFFGSFNLHEPRAACEPQTLTVARLERSLLRHLRVDWRGAIPKVEANGYRPFTSGEISSTIPEGAGILWVRATKPEASATLDFGRHREWFNP